MTALIVLATVVLTIAAATILGSLIEPRLGPVWSFLGIGDDEP